jgi:hypothetical protein
MKNLKFTIILLFITSITFGQRLDIKKAISSKKIKCEIEGSWDTNDKLEFLDSNGQYFGKCITVKVRNIYNDTLNIYIENGLMLLCDDSRTQDMVVTKSIFINLLPKQYKSFQLYAMCAEMHDGMPNISTSYKVGELTNEKLVSITQQIENSFMQNVAGQGAVWSFTDNANIDDLIKYGATESSIEITFDILNKAGIVTELSSKKQASLDSINQIIIDFEKDFISTENSENDNSINIELNTFYFFIIVSFFLICIIIFLLIKKRK